MDRIKIKGAFQVKRPKIGPHGLEIRVGDLSQVSDCYHTFDELYDHRNTLFIALCRIAIEMFASKVLDTIGLEGEKRLADAIARFSLRPWRSKNHTDGSAFDGWFILGIGRKKGEQITYHLPLSRWEETNFAETLDRAPKWDGHTSADVLERLKKL